jgi:threonine/homoserine efflux transporter RhtA
VRFGSERAARLTGITIIIISVIALAWAILHLVIGRQLKKYRPSARLMTLGLAVGNLILLPFGTALGVYALWVLLKDVGRRLFEP